MMMMVLAQNKRTTINEIRMNCTSLVKIINKYEVVKEYRVDQVFESSHRIIKTDVLGY